MHTRAAVLVACKGKSVAGCAFTRLITRPHTKAQPRAHRRTMTSFAQKDFFLDEFAQKQFNDTDPNYSGTRIHFDTANFVNQVQRCYNEGAKLVDGYAPFCKHIFVPNFVGARLGALAINSDNRKLLQSGYSSRRPEELAVLSRCSSYHTTAA